MSSTEIESTPLIPSDILDAALGLDPAQRESLALDLILSLEAQQDCDAGYEEAWAVELENRMRSIEEGTAKTVSWDDVKARLGRRPEARP